jgi:hypothetical protein
LRRVFGDRHHAAVDELDDLSLVHVEDDVEALDRSGVDARRGIRSVEGQGSDQTRPFGCRESHRPRRPPVDVNPAEVGKATPLHRLLPARIGLHDLGALDSSSTRKPGCTPGLLFP